MGHGPINGRTVEDGGMCFADQEPQKKKRRKPEARLWILWPSSVISEVSEKSTTTETTEPEANHTDRSAVGLHPPTESVIDVPLPRLSVRNRRQPVLLVPEVAPPLRVLDLRDRVAVLLRRRNLSRPVSSR